MLNKTYYQPEKNGELPEELWSFQVFKTHEDAFNWLVQHDYDADEWDIVEYHDDDIEEPTFIDEYGDQYEKIEDIPDVDDWWRHNGIWDREEICREHGILYEDFDGEQEIFLDVTDEWWDGLTDEEKLEVYNEFFEEQ